MLNSCSKTTLIRIGIDSHLSFIVKEWQNFKFTKARISGCDPCNTQYHNVTHHHNRTWRSCWPRPPCLWSAARGETAVCRSQCGSAIINVFSLIRVFCLYKWRYFATKTFAYCHICLQKVTNYHVMFTSSITEGSRSTKTALGTCFPDPVSEKKVLKESSAIPIESSPGIVPSGCIPCSRQYSSLRKAN